MNLELSRYFRGPDFTTGSLNIDGVFECWTLEDTVRELGTNCEGKEKGKTAIPSGTYTVVLSYSNRFKKYMPEIQNVPCFSGIRIHSGTNASHTDGCLLVGAESSAGGQIFKSRIAFDLLMRKIKKIEKTEKITITII